MTRKHVNFRVFNININIFSFYTEIIEQHGNFRANFLKNLNQVKLVNLPIRILHGNFRVKKIKIYMEIFVYFIINTEIYVLYFFFR